MQPNDQRSSRLPFQSSPFLHLSHLFNILRRVIIHFASKPFAFDCLTFVVVTKQTTMSAQAPGRSGPTATDRLPRASKRKSRAKISASRARRMEETDNKDDEDLTLVNDGRLTNRTHSIAYMLPVQSPNLFFSLGKQTSIPPTRASA